VHLAGAYLSIAMAHSRTLVPWPGQFDRALLPACQDLAQRGSWECFFFPVVSSDCTQTAQQALAAGAVPSCATSGFKAAAASDAPIVCVELQQLGELYMMEGSEAARLWGSAYLATPPTVEHWGKMQGMSTNESMTHWWRAQATRFMLRWPSAHLCHVINQQRHAAFGMLVANQLATFIPTQTAFLRGLSASNAITESQYLLLSSMDDYSSFLPPPTFPIPFSDASFSSSSSSSSASAPSPSVSPTAQPLLPTPETAPEVPAAAAAAEVPQGESSPPPVRSLHGCVWPQRGFPAPPCSAASCAPAAGCNTGESSSSREESREVGAEEAYRMVGGEVRMPGGMVSVHVRLTDKRSEMQLASFHSHMFLLHRLKLSRPDLQHVWLNTEAQSVIDATSLYPDWTFFYSNNTRQSDISAPQQEQQGEEVLWAYDSEQSVAVSFASLLIAAQCDFFVGSLGSNWSRLINELRSTNGRLLAGFLALNFASLALLLTVASAAPSVVTGPNNPAVSLAAAQGENGVATEVPKGIEQAAAAGNLDKFEGTTIVSPSTDSMLLVDVKAAGWNKMKCHKDLGKPGDGACTPANCSKGGIPAKWKTSNLLKNKLGVEMYVKGNPLTLKKASPQTCCNTCASFKSCTYWQYIPDITIDGKKTEGACYLVHDNIDYSCGELTAQYATDSKPIALQVRTGGECNPAANVVNDPHLVGAFGTHFDFNGRPDKAFCLLTDRDLHVNMLLRGYYSDDTENAALVVDGKAVHTWIKELGLVWFANGADHKLRLAARGGKQQERGDGFMKTIEIDGEEIPRMAVGDEVKTEGGLTLRFAALEKEGPYDVDYYTLAIDGLVSLDMRLRVANPKLQTPNDAEAHINVGIVELEHTDDVHGVLGQTYRPDHAARAADFQRLIANLHRPISSDSEEGVGFLDGTPRSYESSSVLSVDCAHTEYHRAKQLSPVEEFPREPLH
ncbi:unnamed protein product, partial [Closterium sp. NIES-64]